MHTAHHTAPRSNRRRLQLIAQLTALLLAVALAVGAGADFSTQTANAANTFTSGILDHSNDVDGAILTASNMWPGQSVEGTVTIENTGNLVGAFTLDEVDVTSTFRTGMLNLVVHDTTSNVEIYDGDLGDLDSVDLDAFEPGEARTYRFTVTFSEDAENDLDEASSAVATFQWNQTPARVAPAE
jgi:spore coat-associated protein N